MNIQHQRNMLSRRMPTLMKSLIPACLLTLAMTGAAAAQEDDYPTREISLVIPFGPGGIADITARIVGDSLGKKLGKQIVIMNQPGAGGSVAARVALNGEPDGYTLALLSNGTAISVPLFKNLQFDPVADFVPVSSLAYFDFVFVTKADSKFKSLKDILEAARANPAALNVGTINVGSSQNLAAELFKSTAGVDFTIVPYKGTPDLQVALLGGELDMIIDSQTALKAALQQNQAVAIASSGPTRSILLPDVATAEEEGVKGFDVTSWNGIFAPAGTPQAVVDKLNATLVEVLADPDVKKRFAELGVEARSSTPQEIGDRLKADIEKWSKVIEDSGIVRQ
ncbi:tripartite tricarboxylate transporter substrate binding protein [Rhizobium anhuiense]|uniref:Tripartite tricarboxylate transporter substrate binding protein n=2 Tax=Rhizobium/Agrobacterium group TaxID=227290 RepID=A0A3S0Q9V3_9HYPH|nr:tripartite tricarboxylate transporter substrate binding protein [Rhizobium anhuiense]PDS40393.1 tripartite tricarboxylate transporter substrate binding protein [Rhizobium anhuiense]PDS50559.1 tripartite tricarboxylate transporter substrate binding protein [Rhizobium anhuiense]PDS60925.1 tripartite tricarboxylate transporter substrate binding protein [Rhizobium anhuiense]RUM00087.1 tripartite tricarboxylate transporter substrate binding protein [Rhizobium anhuiense]